MVDQEFVKSLIDGVILAGAPGSAPYQAALNQLIATQAGLLAKIQAAMASRSLALRPANRLPGARR
jgi:hypothetical protein